ncbi:MAG: GNAT family N-acetyltransferase [Paracoccaceae bacterium]|nr:GNAT family N-acetyltransferase [Paracoccaceae bacterium]
MRDFETERLRVRDWTPRMQEAALRRGLRDLLTPAVLAHLPPPLWPEADDDLSAWVAARQAESQVMLVLEREDGALLGLLILADPDRSGDVPVQHVGYLLGEAAWGQGYASELVRGLVDVAQGPLRLIGGVARDNPASARVLEKAGFARDGDLSGAETDLYVLDIV